MFNYSFIICRFIKMNVLYLKTLPFDLKCYGGKPSAIMTLGFLSISTAALTSTITVTVRICTYF